MKTSYFHCFVIITTTSNPKQKRFPFSFLFMWQTSHSTTMATPMEKGYDVTVDFSVCFWLMNEWLDVFQRCHFVKYGPVFCSRSEVQEFELVNSDLTLKKSLKSYHLSLSPFKGNLQISRCTFCKIKLKLGCKDVKSRCGSHRNKKPL